ncbi:MAG: glycosyltransferase family 2 protein [Lewinellaceae bacterium]|nr:glycosyltransferase family 2 protein [Lewinellaceae bacterium]
MNTGLSIIIVNFNSGYLLKRCCQSVKNHLSYPHEIIIVDNHSSDHSVEEIEKLNLENIKVIKNQSNLGFSRANNLGISLSNSDIILFLNPDAYFDEDSGMYLNIWLQEQFKSNCLYSAILIDGKNKKIQKTKHEIPTIGNLINKLTRRKVIYWYTGAFVLASSKIVHQLNGWSEDYFLYGEDLDLFYRAHQAGIEVSQIQCAITHIGNEIGKNFITQKEKMSIGHYTNYLFYKKNKRILDYYLFPIYLFLVNLIKGNKHGFMLFSSFINYNLHRQTNESKVIAIYDRLKKL